MEFPWSPRSRRLLLGGSLAGMGLLSMGRLVEYDPIPWVWVTAFAVGTVLVVGPLTWIVRDWFPVEQRELLSAVAACIALLCFSVVLGLGLIFGNLLLILDAGTLGGIVGLAVALVIERIRISDQSRGSV